MVPVHIELRCALGARTCGAFSKKWRAAPVMKPKPKRTVLDVRTHYQRRRALQSILSTRPREQCTERLCALITGGKRSGEFFSHELPRGAAVDLLSLSSDISMPPDTTLRSRKAQSACERKRCSRRSSKS
eukprot:IDg20786t1